MCPISADEIPYQELFLGFAVAVTCVHKLLDFRQLKALRNPKPPPELEGAFKDADLYKKSQAYSIEKLWFSVVHSLYSLAETVIMIVCGVLPWAWTAAGHAVSSFPLASLPPQAAAWAAAAGVGSAGARALGLEVAPLRQELAQSVVFMLGASGFSLITGLPWSLYSTFVIEARHGFNKQTLGLFFTDILKTVALGLLFMPPLVAGITYILLTTGPLMPLYLWSFMFCVALFFMTIYPSFIQPLFNKFDPLPEGELKQSIEELAGSLKFPLKKLYTMDGSKRSGHSNAYMYGFHKNKRIVLFDTLISQCTPAQVVAVLAHELGHWKLRHTPILFTTGQVQLLLNFVLFSFIRSEPALFKSFGFEGQGQPAIVALVLFSMVMSPFEEVVSLLMHSISRAFEFQADRFAVKLHKGPELRSALLLLQEKNKGALHVDPWYSMYHYSHPHLLERLKAIDRGIAAVAKKAT